ncbi:DUF6286 domain-containing protein [Streptomyces sp. NPDC001380]|uniref:DUF6286 domain-containing protein n=1 Tax=Streptomyces sp. NPDC001380 TaxID=3364566 RepID=UPI0036CCB52F
MTHGQDPLRKQDPPREQETARPPAALDTAPAGPRPAGGEPAGTGPAGTGPAGTGGAGGRDGGAAGLAPSPRLWSPRRVPAALVALVVLVAAGAALYDVVAVRAGRPASAWRRTLADELATRTTGDVWMLTGAAVAAALGLWLLVLALTPGLRKLLPLRAPTGDSPVRAVLDRHGAEVLLRDAALRVPGVGRARVRVRRRIKARADVRFRDPRQVREEVAGALREERDRLALVRPERVSVRVRRAR